MRELPIVIRDNELIVGTLTINPREAQVSLEFSNKWLLGEIDRIGERRGDIFLVPDNV